MHTLHAVLLGINLLLCGVNSWTALLVARHRRWYSRRAWRRALVLPLAGFCFSAANALWIAVTF